MGAVQVRVATRNRACQALDCKCWRESEAHVLFDPENGRHGPQTWREFRDDVAHQMNLPPEHVVLYRLPLGPSSEPVRFWGGREVPLDKPYDPGHGKLYAVEFGRE